jgi:16S rRNA (uracil1498-N3)-methyltransferase
MRRIIVKPEQVGDSWICLTDKAEINHVKNVLRMQEGDKVVISDSIRFEYEASIKSISSDEIIFTIEDKQAITSEPVTKVTLFQCVPKGGKMEYVIQKCVELGIHAITPVYSDRSIPKQANEKDTVRKTERLNKIAREAAKQCGRSLIPAVSTPVTMEVLPVLLSEFEFVLMPYENEENISIKHVLRARIDDGKKIPREIALVIGPEGGFSDSETNMLSKTGAHLCTLGNAILRTETAGMAALAMIMYEYEL